jgi:HD-like signal output (HDOD) protein
MRRLNPQVLRRQPEVQERQRLQRAERQAAVQLEQGLLEQELVLPQEPPVLRELLQVPYQPWAQPSQALA